jgi:hypothetical protein
MIKKAEAPKAPYASSCEHWLLCSRCNAECKARATEGRTEGSDPVYDLCAHRLSRQSVPPGEATCRRLRIADLGHTPGVRARMHSS